MITSLGVVCAPICPTLSISSNEHMEHMKNVAIYLHGTIKGVCRSGILFPTYSCGCRFQTAFKFLWRTNESRSLRGRSKAAQGGCWRCR